MWNADIYNRYGKERMQPSIDLADRISHKRFKRILDVGCGTGMSTATLAAVWKDAAILGTDIAEEMLQKARKELPSVTFIQRDCSKAPLDFGMFDLIFSNAFLQWIPGQEEFIADCFKMLNVGGIFAVQVPLFEEMPASDCIINAEKSLLNSVTAPDENKYVLHSSSEYYDMLSKSTDKISMWITEYCHEMNSHEQILDFLRGAALRPYLDKLDVAEEQVFMSAVLENIKKAYCLQKNGKILFPFRRLFLTGEK